MKHFFACLGLAALAMTGTAHASQQLAVEHGCYSCHGSYPRGEAPDFEKLAGKMAKYHGDATALANKVSRFRTGEAFEHIDAHERLSTQTATALLKWLAEGGR